MNARHLTNWILSVKDSSGSLITDPTRVPQVFVSFFSDLLSPHDTLVKPSLEDLQQVIRSPLSDAQVCSIAAPVSDSEIKDTIFSLPRSKAPGPDGFTAELYKNNWRIVGPLVIRAVNDFFSSGHLLKEVNATILALIPKYLMLARLLISDLLRAAILFIKSLQKSWQIGLLWF